MTIIDPLTGDETNVIAGSTLPLKSTEIEVIVELDYTFSGAETELELPDPQVIIELIPSLISAESDATANPADADRLAFIPAISLSDLIGDPELHDVTIWEISRLQNALAAWEGQTR